MINDVFKFKLKYIKKNSDKSIKFKPFINSETIDLFLKKNNIKKSIFNTPRIILGLKSKSAKSTFLSFSFTPKYISNDLKYTFNKNKAI